MIINKSKIKCRVKYRIFLYKITRLSINLTFIYLLFFNYFSIKKLLLMIFFLLFIKYIKITNNFSLSKISLKRETLSFSVKAAGMCCANVNNPVILGRYKFDFLFLNLLFSSLFFPKSEQSFDPETKENKYHIFFQKNF